MSRKIEIKAGSVSVTAELYDNQMANDVWDILPIEGSARTWGDEIYFPIDLKSGYNEDKKAVVNVGELAFWEPGNAFCIFFGTTPGSDVPRPADPATVFGKVIGDTEKFKSVSSASDVKITKI